MMHAIGGLACTVVPIRKYADPRGGRLASAAIIQQAAGSPLLDPSRNAGSVVGRVARRAELRDELLTISRAKLHARATDEHAHRRVR